MEGVEWKVGLIYLYAVIHHKALPLEILAKPHSECLLLQNSLRILKKSGEDPASSFREDFKNFQILGAFSLDELNLKIPF